MVRRLHKRIMQDDRDSREPPGDLRAVSVWIGGREMAYSIFNPPRRRDGSPGSCPP